MSIPILDYRLVGACITGIIFLLQGCRADKETISIARYQDRFAITIKEILEADPNLPYSERVKEFTNSRNPEELTEDLQIIDDELYVIYVIEADDRYALVNALDRHGGRDFSLQDNLRLIIDFEGTAERHRPGEDGFLWFGRKFYASDIRRYVDYAISKSWSPPAEPVKNSFGITTGYFWDIKEGEVLTFMSPNYVYMKIKHDPDGNMDRICFKEYASSNRYPNCTSLYPDYLRYLPEAKLYRSALTSMNIDDYETYLVNYPRGLFADQAKDKMREIYLKPHKRTIDRRIQLIEDNAATDE